MRRNETVPPFLQQKADEGVNQGVEALQFASYVFHIPKVPAVMERISNRRHDKICKQMKFLMQMITDK